jgi:DNA-directed RNA polymerase specialized sigma24 family protein
MYGASCYAGGGEPGGPARAPGSDRRQDGITVAEWFQIKVLAPDEAWMVLWRLVMVAARRIAPRTEAEDLAGETALRFLEAGGALVGRASLQAPLAALVRRVAMNIHFRSLAKRWRRRAIALRLAARGDGSRLVEPVSRATPAAIAELADEVAALLRAAGSLPPPFRQIALRRLDGATLSEVTAFLRAWRPIGSDEARRLWRLTTNLLQSILGTGGSRGFPRPCEAGKPWATTPPVAEG